MKTKLLFSTLLLLTALSTQAQEKVRIVRWISPITGDFESMLEGRNTDAQLESWGYKTKTYQYSAYKTRPSDPNAIAVYRWTMPNCAASIMFGEHEITDAQLRQWGYKDKELQFYAYRSKPATGDFVAVNRWINAKPQGDKCRDFTLTVAETEHPDQRLIGYGYSGKTTQFWVPRPVQELDMKDDGKRITDLFVATQPLNPGFETGNLTGWTSAGNGFRLDTGDVSMPVLAWGPNVMPLGGDYWRGLTPDFKSNNGRQGVFFASSAAAGTNRVELISSEFKPTKQFITFLMGVNWSGVNWRAADDLPKLRVELLVADNGKAIERIVKSQESRDRPIDPKTGRPVTFPVLDRKPSPQTNVDGKSYSIVETVFFTTANTPTPQQFYRQYLNKYEGVCRIRVVDEAAYGSIIVDDFRVQDTEGAVVVVPKKPLWGFVDMHMHPMSHLGFGRKIMHGQPDNPSNQTDIVTALGSCNHNHGGWGLDNTGGNYIRMAILKMMDKKNPYNNGEMDHNHNGFPLYPNHASIAHQQMWHEWIQRAHQGGLRIMVALAVNNYMLAEAVAGDPGYKTDKESADRQLDFMVEFVGRHPFMQIARSPQELRTIVNQGKLAVILGIEVDNFGDFNRPGMVVNETTIKAEIQRLYNQKGVRYMFPMHFADTPLGGCAIYEPSNLSNLASHFSRSFVNSTVTPPEVIATLPGLKYRIERAPDTRITYRLTNQFELDVPGVTNAVIAPLRGLLEAIEGLPSPCAGAFLDLVRGPICAFAGINLACPDLRCALQDKTEYRIVKGFMLTPSPEYEVYASIQGGHRNAVGITSLGTFAIKEMMRLGMMIDIDHMSEKMVESVIAIASANQYPINSGHTGFRGNGGNSENTRTDEQLNTIRYTGGMMGVGIANNISASFLTGFRYGMGKLNGITIGSDLNGMEVMPFARFNTNGTLKNDYSIFGEEIKIRANNQVRYTTTTIGSNTPLIMSQTAGKQWNYNFDGMAHVGLYPDYFQDLKNIGMTSAELARLFMGAEYFARMWEKCEQQKSQVR